MQEVFITTHDNPYDYWTQFDEWLAFDRQMGYYTLEYLGRIAKLANDLSDQQEQQEIESAIDAILEWNGSFYKKIYKENIENESKDDQNDQKE